MAYPRSLFDKVWDAHVVTPESASNPAVVYIDLHLIHEVTSPQAFTELAQRGLPVRRPDRTLATVDHSTPTLINPDGTRPFVTEQAERQVEQLIANATAHDIPLHAFDSPHRGIVHVMGPELGAVQPGMTVVCGDSHTSTHGAFGCLAFGIGTTQVGHVLATQCLLIRKPKSMAIHVNGELGAGVTPKDVILHIIAQIGVGGGTGHTLEYRGNVFEEMSMEGRMTVCNMSIEAGARAGMIAPDQTTLDWLKGRPMLPSTDYDILSAEWLALRSDPACTYDSEVHIDAADIRPMLTYGTHPGHGVAVDAPIPAPADASDQKALDYMQVDAGASMQGLHVDRVFIGSCTNSRIEDMREAARILSMGQVPASVKAIVVPGSEAVKLQAEAEGLHELITASGAEWREPGCSMCIAMNGDMAAPGELVVSTSNRNFAGRQGPGARTVLASPAMAAAAAISGEIVDVRTMTSKPVWRRRMAALDNTSAGLDALVNLISKLPPLDGPIGSGMSDEGMWWVKFALNADHPAIWAVIQEFGYLLNYISLDDRLPTVFKPVSPPPYLNGGPEYLSWVIENTSANYGPEHAAAVLNARLPQPLDDPAAWILEE